MQISRNLLSIIFSVAFPMASHLILTAAEIIKNNFKVIKVIFEISADSSLICFPTFSSSDNHTPEVKHVF